MRANANGFHARYAAFVSLFYASKDSSHSFLLSSQKDFNKSEWRRAFCPLCERSDVLVLNEFHSSLSATHVIRKSTVFPGTLDTRFVRLYRIQTGRFRLQIYLESYFFIGNNFLALIDNSERVAFD